MSMLRRLPTMMSVPALALTLFLLAPVAGHAGGFVSNFDSPPVAQVTLSGNANYLSGFVQLTDNVGGQDGTMLVDDLDPSVAVNRFSAHSRIFIGGGGGADGMSFSFGDETSIVNAVDGVTTGLAVSLDTFDNGGGDVFNAIEVFYDSASIATSGALTLRTGSFVNLDIVVDVGGGITVHHNNVLAIAATIPGWTPTAGRRFLWRAATGGVTDFHAVDDVVIATGDATSYFDDFDSPPASGFTLYGDAHYDTGAAKLTTTAPAGQTGSAILDDIVPGLTMSGFAAHFRLLIGNGGGADGFSFNFGDFADGPINEEGAGSGLILRFDTFDNGGGDFANEIEVVYGGVSVASTGVRTLRTGNYRDVTVVVTPDGRLGVSHENGADTSVPLADVALTSWAPASGWRFGFGGRTGGITDDHWIETLLIEPVACGDGDLDPSEECDDGNTADGDCCSSTCTFETAGSACTSDGNDCTDDACNATGTCTYTNNTASCDDGLFCNGADTCSGGSCSIHAGDPCAGGAECQDTCNEAADNCFNPAGSSCTDDGNICTDDECDGAGACAHPNNSASCDDAEFCNGADTCSGGSCSTHAGDPCPGADGDGDCAESCDEVADSCLAPDPNGSACDDGTFCNGTETCTGIVCTNSSGDPCPGADGDGDCSESCDEAADDCLAADPDTSACDDGAFCNGADTCAGGSCAVHAGDPCAGGAECNDDCDETLNNCFNPSGTICTDDGDICTDDECDGTGTCSHTEDPSNDPSCATTTTTTTTSTTVTLPGPANCPAAPQPACLTATRAKLQSKEKSLGKEQIKLQWKKVSETTAQADFGNPVDVDTSVAVCIYNDVDALVQDYLVDRAGEQCGTKPCWSAKSDKGYGYKDKAISTDGIAKIGYKAGDAGKGRASVGGKNNGSKGQTSLPTGVALALISDVAPTIQILTSDGLCVGATMTEVKKADGLQYKAQKK